MQFLKLKVKLLFCYLNQVTRTLIKLVKKAFQLKSPLVKSFQNYFYNKKFTKDIPNILDMIKYEGLICVCRKQTFEIVFKYKIGKISASKIFD